MTQKKHFTQKKLFALTAEMEADVSSYCRDKGIESESELIRQAIAKYIYADYADETLKLQGLKTLEAKASELRDMVDILFRYTRLMHTNLLSYHAEIESEYIDAAFESATRRHGKFFDAFTNSLKNDPPFFEHLLHKYYSEG
jgi:hypothetical protein